MKKYIRYSLIISCVLIVILFSIYILTKDKGVKLFESTFNQRLPQNVKSVEVNNNYSGIPYEGFKVYSYKFSVSDAENFTSKIKNSSTWKPYPLSEELNLVMYGGKKSNINYDYDLAVKAGIPEIKNGFWALKNKNQTILDGTSFNFTLALFDTINNTMYLFKIDT